MWLGDSPPILLDTEPMHGMMTKLMEEKNEGEINIRQLIHQTAAIPSFGLGYLYC
jgi:hypothetical protein